MRRWILAIAALLLADAAAGRLLVRLRPGIDLPIAERRLAARLEQESVERQYRVESAIYDHDLIKNFEGDAQWGPLRYHVATDSLGFRDGSRRDVPLETSRRRVLLLGDSFTEGLGLDYADTYAGLIAARLGREDVDVLNAGVTSYAPAIYYAKMRYLLEDAGLHCTDVVVFIDISDAEDEARYYDLHADGHVSRMVEGRPGRGPEFDTGGEAGEPVPATLAADGHATRAIETPVTPAPADAGPHAAGPARDDLPSRLKRYSIIMRALATIEDWRGAADPPIAYPQGNPRRGLWTVDERDYEAFGRTGLELGSHHMDRLAALLHRRGIPLTVAVYPWPDQVRYDTADSIAVRYWRRWAGLRGAGFVDLFEPFFRDADRTATIGRYYIPGDVHFSRQGSRLVADTFLAQWRQGHPS